MIKKFICIYSLIGYIFLWFTYLDDRESAFILITLKRERTSNHSTIWFILGGYAPRTNQDSLVCQCSFCLLLHIKHWYLFRLIKRNFTIAMNKCWILLKLALAGGDGNLHFSVPSMNRLDKTERAAFSILLFWAFFRDSNFLYFIIFIWTAINVSE
jgi:hypothetical protein